MTATRDRPVNVDCDGSSLVAVHSPAHRSAAAGRPGIVIVVGGPQYRVGSHRQFVLQARAWAGAGLHVFRFDYRGMGDSDGAPRDFEAVEGDIRAAIDEFMRQVPELPGVVLFGLCDAASAVLMYAHADPRVRGLMLANPWVRTELSEARATLWHYYPRRLLQRSFWTKTFGGKLNPLRAWRDLAAAFQRISNGSGSAMSRPTGHFIARMQSGLRSFDGPVAVFLSGDDLTAAEFKDLCRKSGDWTRVMGGSNVTVIDLPKADHTFSRRLDLDEFLRQSAMWLREAFPLTGAESPDA